MMIIHSLSILLMLTVSASQFARAGVTGFVFEELSDEGPVFLPVRLPQKRSRRPRLLSKISVFGVSPQFAPSVDIKGLRQGIVAAMMEKATSTCVQAANGTPLKVVSVVKKARKK